MIGLGGKNSLRRNVLVVVIASPWLLAALIRLLGLDTFWPAIPLVAFTPQLLLTTALPLLIALLLRAWWSALGLALLMLVLAGVIAPRVVGQDQPVADGRELRIFSANLMKGAAETSALVRQIRASDADLVALQEAGEDNLRALRAAGLLGEYRHRVMHSSDGTYANYTLARGPLRAEGENVGLTGVWPVITSRDLGVDFQNFHSLSPVLPSHTGAWRTALGSLLGPGTRTRIIAGDFNATVDHREFRRLLARGYNDAGLATGQGLTWTWSVGPATRLTIDHILVPKDVAVEDFRVQELPGSDHRSVSARLRLPK